MSTPAFSFLTQSEAEEVDRILMSEEMGFSIDQLMELAGLSVAECVAESFPPQPSAGTRVLVVAGPGNNGGDGLVAARHLAHSGYEPYVWYPKPTDRDLYRRLVKQCAALGIVVSPDAPPRAFLDSCVAIVDAVFGFSFRGDVRAPFDVVLRTMHDSGVPIVSVDIPSGWDVERGPGDALLRPAVLISLTAPKLCARFFHGRHFLGGRFVPPALVERFGLVLPSYVGRAQCVEFPREMDRSSL
jgi:NAD(P)H-hydrate epimerase